MSGPVQGALWMLLAQALFAAMNVGARAVGDAVPWQEVCGTRMLVGAIVAFVIARARGQSLAIKRKKEAWMRTVFGTLSAAGTFFVLAQADLAVGDAVTLFAMSPVFVALLSWPFLGEKVRGSTAIAVVVAFGGILIVAQPSFRTAGGIIAVGALTALGSAVAMIWLRKVGPGESGEAIVFHFMAFGTVAMLALAVPVWRTPDAETAGLLALTGVSGGLAQLAMTRAYALDQASRVAALSYTGVVMTRGLAIPLFGERPGVPQIAGSALVIGAGVALALRAAYHARR